MLTGLHHQRHSQQQKSALGLIVYDGREHTHTHNSSTRVIKECGAAGEHIRARTHKNANANFTLADGYLGGNSNSDKTVRENSFALNEMLSIQHELAHTHTHILMVWIAYKRTHSHKYHIIISTSCRLSGSSQFALVRSARFCAPRIKTPLC